MPLVVKLTFRLWSVKKRVNQVLGSLHPRRSEAVMDLCRFPLDALLPLTPATPGETMLSGAGVRNQSCFRAV